MDDKLSDIYYRLELPTDEESTQTTLEEIKAFAKSKGIGINKVHVEEFAPSEPSKFQQMLEELPTSKSTLLLVQSLHHITKGNMTDLIIKLGQILESMEAVVSISDDIEINEEIYKVLAMSFRLLDSLGTKIKTEKINVGIHKKRQSSPDGKVHQGKKKGNYRKTDKDEVVAKLRSEGYTLQQIADKENMSVGRVRNILKSVREEQGEDVPMISFMDYKGLKSMT